MRTFSCSCGNRLYFENTECLSCGLEAGWCPVCQTITSLNPGTQSGEYTCGQDNCGALLRKCQNYAGINICNRCLSPGVNDKSAPLCDSCRLTDVIPDLTIPGNPEKWYRLEVAKRRLLYLLDYLNLPYGRAEDGTNPPLSFDFKGDIVPADQFWRMMATERVYTGHHDGKITINIREADDAEREKIRVDMQESHRTLAGHFRHEIGHYYWQMLIQDQREAEFSEVFGDFRQPSYTEALGAYYLRGPVPDWSNQFVSAYASMHAWEDFAETFALYLDMVDVLDTANHSELLISTPPLEMDIQKMISRYLELGIAANELNRSMGLLDLVPEVLTPAVCEKLTFIDSLIASTAHVSSVENQELV